MSVGSSPSLHSSRKDQEKSRPWMTLCFPQSAVVSGEAAQPLWNKAVWETKEVGKRNKSLSYWTSLGWEETARVSSVPGQYAAFSRFKGLKYGYKWKRQMKKDLEGVGGAGVQEYNLLYNSFCEGWHTYQREGLWPGPIGGTMGWVGRHSPSQPAE